jgi:hypothetical protein
VHSLDQITAANFKVRKPAVVAQECIAHVTMFATVVPDQRDHVLARFPGADCVIASARSTHPPPIAL